MGKKKIMKIKQNKKLPGFLWTNKSLRENKDSEKETDLRHIKNERKEPRLNKGFLVKGGNISRMERNYDYEAFGKREGESQRVLLSSLASGMPLQWSSYYFLENLGLYYLFQLKYAGELLLFKNTVIWLLSINSKSSSQPYLSFILKANIPEYFTFHNQLPYINQ